MKHDITTIPISEILEETEGCFVCRMHRLLEERAVEYTGGSAMMEPDVRVKMNELGFCARHYKMLEDKSARLPLGLIIKSRLEHINSRVLKGDAPKTREAARSAYKCASAVSSCYICDKIEWSMSRMLSNFLKKFADEKEIRDMYMKQDFICLPHYALLADIARSELNKKYCGMFLSATSEMCRKYSVQALTDITEFCSMFDYRNGGAAGDGAEGAVERAVSFLGGDAD